MLKKLLDNIYCMVPGVENKQGFKILSMPVPVSVIYGEESGN